MARSARIAELNLDPARTPEPPSATVAGTVDKIIPSPRPKQPERAQIAIDGAEPRHRDLRIDNTSTDEHGDDVKLKKGAHVEVTVTAEPKTSTTLRMKDFAFAAQSASRLPRQNRATYGIAVVVHILFIALLIHIRTQPVRVSSAGSPFASMTAYVPGPAAAGSAASASKPLEPKKTALTTKAAKPVAQDDHGGAGTPGVVEGGQSGSGPVRFGSGGNLTLIKKVTPIYPVLMQTARMTGHVVLDAIIHADGTIGDITLLQSTNNAFAQSAIAAVKQWRYTAPGFEGILTVSVNFTLPG